MSRLTITKTPKVFVGGAFIRSESSRVLPVYARDGRLLGNVPRCTRKDLRNAVEGAASAAPGWAKRTAYNRGQILYRLAEMMESRSQELAACLAESSQLAAEAAMAEVAASVDRLIYYAGWADKAAQVLGNSNPVAGPFFNFTVPEPMGVVGVLVEDSGPALLGLVSQVAPILVSGNVVIALAAEPAPMPAILLGEILAVSDLPAGVINLLTGQRAELVPTFATHEGLRAVDAAGVSEAEARTLGMGAAESLKRLKIRVPGSVGWHSEHAQGLEEISAFIEYKTIWHPIGA
jgi:acyl-CoA reductase-like NAD-dependent aldehyde dehydrogenase